MPREIIIIAYQFDELSDDAKENAIEGLNNINVTHDWWDGVYEDAKIAGFKITSFDLGRGGSIEIEKIDNELEIASNIIRNHGGACETYQIAVDFLAEHAPIFSIYLENEDEELGEHLIELEYEFICMIKREYFKMLENDYEYYTSKEAVKETIIVNEYEFTENGELL